MDVERRLGFEGLAARITDIRSFAGMGTPVVLPRGLGRERSAAQIARKILQLRMYVL